MKIPLITLTVMALCLCAVADNVTVSTGAINTDSVTGPGNSSTFPLVLNDQYVTLGTVYFDFSGETSGTFNMLVSLDGNAIVVPYSWFIDDGDIVRFSGTGGSWDLPDVYPGTIFLTSTDAGVNMNLDGHAQIILSGTLADGVPGNDPVPEPATLVLFGTGLIALARPLKRFI